MLILLEYVNGYYIIEKEEGKKYKIKNIYKFKNNLESLNEVKKLQKGIVSEILLEFLKSKVGIQEIIVFDKKLVENLNKLGISAIQGEIKLYREIKNIPEESDGKDLHICHKLADEKVKLENGDVMVIQSIRLIEDIDKDINHQCMRIREWYGMHFPELGNEISDNIKYLEMVKKIGHKENLKSDFDENIYNLSKISIGTKISDDDMSRIMENIDNVLNLQKYRKELCDYLKIKMQELAPNLSYLLGDQFTAKLISHCGSFSNLVKIPASTFQILGAEKALFNALRSKSNTPKYGFYITLQ